MSEQENSVSFFRFKDLRIYAKAVEYIAWVQEETGYLHENQQLIFGEKFVKAAQGIALNIVEGSVRNKVQFIYYLKIAKSFIRECVIYTDIAAKSSILSEEKIHHSVCQLMELTKMTGKLLTSLQDSIPPINRKEKVDDFSEVV
ncbi:MAG: four helix bundle protein [Bacteroidales bacterium]|jgi:four helix bundle protein|nr:four helix bundle protein [Bacteroidales bacterium]